MLTHVNTIDPYFLFTTKPGGYWFQNVGKKVIRVNGTKEEVNFGPRKGRDNKVNYVLDLQASM